MDHIIEEGRFPLVLGGDHSIAIGTLNRFKTFLARWSSG
ncbi:glycerol-1-phosphate prenyltransferase [Bacillus thuringiensis serovar kurstaki str. HD-1]|nr:glycerol-1-phosphate prenyltransferase [Bacillus thuringiensis serovar kurstaki str. HD-1]